MSRTHLNIRLTGETECIWPEVAIAIAPAYVFTDAESYSNLSTTEKNTHIHVIVTPEECYKYLKVITKATIMEKYVDERWSKYKTGAISGCHH
jgi:hypothetical protein